MSVVVVGLEQRQAPLDLLEQVAVGENALPKALGMLRDRANLSEAVVLSTCLRTEVYAVVERFHDGVAELQEFFAAIAGLPVEALTDHLITRFDDDVADHIFTVASGLDSAVLGESEVLGQVRRAWERAQRERASGPVLGSLFRHAVETGKRVRSETAIARGITSLSNGAVALAANRREGGLTGCRVLVVGAGEMGEGVMRAMASHEPTELVVVNRTSARAAELVAGLPAELAARSRVGSMATVPEELARADVVFTSVATTHPIIEMSVLESALSRRQSGDPLVVVDLGVPRNVEPAAASLPGVTLLDMDALRAAVEGALSGRQGELAQAQEIVADQLERYRVAARARGAAPVVSALRSRAEEVRRSELERHRSKLSELTEEQWSQVDAVTRSTVAKLLHEPTVAVKDAAGTPRGERLVEALRALFDL
ncbi:MAG: glutamyl-tRNA reductase [Acidimicrobiaceae bacterium]|nr:glutamyl-tRNA reductase [Acidimicrobiaceae bacterium]